MNKYSFLPDNILIEIAKMENIEITEKEIEKLTDIAFKALNKVLPNEEK